MVPTSVLGFLKVTREGLGIVKDKCRLMFLPFVTRT